MSQVTYPTQIEEYLDEWQDALQDPEFLLEHGVDPSYVKEAVRQTFGPILMEQWISMGEVEITPELADPLIARFIVCAVLLEMKEEGYIDSIEDEDGDEVFWATPKGKEYAKKNKM
jgi:hypothetical protein